VPDVIRMRVEALLQLYHNLIAIDRSQRDYGL
jgi:hypothetical protein